MEAIDHLDLVVTALERSLVFYRGLLEPLGYVHVGEIAGERGERVVYLSRHGGGGSLSLRECQSGAHPPPYDRYGIGIHHIAFAASSQALVDERAARLREQAAEIENAPREYDYTPGYYAVFLHDPDGLKLEMRTAAMIAVASAAALGWPSACSPASTVGSQSVIDRTRNSVHGFWSAGRSCSWPNSRR